ncbi:MAG: glycosyltransferase family 9 protein [Gemmatimonadaceae bacterium]
MIRPPTPRPRIIVSRTDRMGDVVLTLPLCALLKERLGAEVVFLGRAYTRPIVECSPHVDQILDWDVVANRRMGERRKFIAAVGADAIIHAFPHARIAAAAYAADVPVRIGTGHRWYHWLTCNGLEHFTRKGSPLHEAQLNVRLARRLLSGDPPSLAELVPRARLEPRGVVPPDIAALLDRDRFTLVIHPRSLGSGREWPLGRWHALATALPPSDFRVLVTGTAAEGAAMREWLETLPDHATDLTGRLHLDELIALLARVDGVVAAGTGPLHLAAALGTNALGLFPSTPPIHPARWAPLGRRASFLAAAWCHNCDRRSGPCSCMESITVAAVAERVRAWAARATEGSDGVAERP